MKIAPLPPNESARIASLRLLNILDTQPEERFDRLTRMAKRLFDVSIAQVTLVDTDRQWFKSSAGTTATQTPRDVSFCAHAILDDKMMLVPDARLDDRFSDNPLVTGDPNIRFYAGCPLKIGDNNLGTLCVLDDKPRTFDDEEAVLLKDLADMVTQELAAIQQATTDHLTGLSNRRGFEILAQHSFSLCVRINRPITLLFFDLNHFKQINDLHGHAEGDHALKTFANGLLAIFRDSDVIGRLGGDEFAVLLTDTTTKSAADALARLKSWFADHARDHAHPYTLSFSVGQIQFDPAEHSTLDQLLAQADAIMYHNKKASRQAPAQ